MNIYLDTCCFNRPFDDQSQPRIRLESEAIASVLMICENRQATLLGSSMLELEFTKITDEDRRSNILLLYRACANKIDYNINIKQRALEFTAHNVKPADALHLALAEHGNAVLLTTDDKLIKAAARTSCETSAMNPVDWLLEVYTNG